MELNIIGRENALLNSDIDGNSSELIDLVESSSFLVIGGAGSIGQAVTKEIFERNPKLLHVVDISENNLAELVRDIRSSVGYIEGEFKTFVLDIGSHEFDVFMAKGVKYDYVLNLSALKHVRSEKDQFTLMRLINVNIFNTIKTIEQSIEMGAKKYFCVSTDKATNPVNMMGASKRIMEKFLSKYQDKIEISTARFANVAFSDGSLLHSFKQRIEKKQPIVAPKDVKRYFVTPKEAGQLCLLSCMFGRSGDIYFPKLDSELDLLNLDQIAKNYLESLRLTPHLCESEEEARSWLGKNSSDNVWPCFFTTSDTAGEKPFEEFFSEEEELDLELYENLGVIKNGFGEYTKELDTFEATIERFKAEKKWTKEELLKLFELVIPEFEHISKSKYLDDKM
ncbi:UDP-N-acetylglucosamine 4,6-dehydratase [Pseudoalteromonas ardens]|uniref:UDP-N-acetylglucosamine 4,6-dehydratase n=1 Tax=Pseudoalteromonas rubra TaxID=43658 RepID=A0A0L0ETL2_9GAMM|nr:UDP-N-acetylglucosamine 4,6-dehydratase [Pseudoalteromonas sp. R96]KNC67754.1 UDP-N-acetylglucosamine 4,6-dehydratase [Pseudoalteromonas rubra]MDK1312563.1 UDP-N-acetylglucosamine 4,6-dehydratase [Pseudoalteromonas sp. R96]